MHHRNQCQCVHARRVLTQSRGIQLQEMAYNLVYSLGQHSYDADCHLFLRIFSGDVEEAVRGEQAALEQEVRMLARTASPQKTKTMWCLQGISITSS